MLRFETSKEIHERCVSEGKLKRLHDIDTRKIEAMKKQARIDLEQVERLVKLTPKQGDGWSTIYKLSYDAIRSLVDAYLLFDKIKSDNHQCLFAHLCECHAELELDWAFFEKIRTKRNGIHYYGEAISYLDWKDISLQIELYTSLLEKEIEKKMDD